MNTSNTLNVESDYNNRLAAQAVNNGESQITEVLEFEWQDCERIFRNLPKDSCDETVSVGEAN